MSIEASARSVLSYNSELEEELGFVQELIRKNSLLIDLVERARQCPSKVVIACITDDPRSLMAADIVNRLVGSEQITLLNNHTLNEVDKNNLSLQLADTLHYSAQKKVANLQRQLANLAGDPHPDVVKAKEKVEGELQKAEDNLREDFLQMATKLINGPHGSLWQSCVLAFAQQDGLGGVVGGADADTGDFIKAFLKSNPQASPDQFFFASYFETGPILRRHIKHQFETRVDGTTIRNAVKALSDPAFNPRLSSEKMAAIGNELAVNFRRIVPDSLATAIIAFITYSTGKSGAGDNVELVRNANTIYHERYPQGAPAYGPTQWDAATSRIAFPVKRASMITKGATPEEIAAFDILEPGATISVLSDLHGTNPLAKAQDEVWPDSVQMGPLFFVIQEGKVYMIPASDLSRGAPIESIVGTLLATLVMTNQTENSTTIQHSR